jgi:hypothetical protein
MIKHDACMYLSLEPTAKDLLLSVERSCVEIRCILSIVVYVKVYYKRFINSLNNQFFYIYLNIKISYISIMSEFVYLFMFNVASMLFCMTLYKLYRVGEKKVKKYYDTYQKQKRYAKIANKLDACIKLFFQNMNLGIFCLGVYKTLYPYYSTNMKSPVGIDDIVKVLDEIKTTVITLKNTVSHMNNANANNTNIKKAKVSTSYSPLSFIPNKEYYPVSKYNNNSSVLTPLSMSESDNESDNESEPKEPEPEPEPEPDQYNDKVEMVAKMIDTINFDNK